MYIYWISDSDFASARVTSMRKSSVLQGWAYKRVLFASQILAVFSLTRKVFYCGFLNISESFYVQWSLLYISFLKLLSADRKKFVSDLFGNLFLYLMFCFIIFTNVWRAFFFCKLYSSHTPMGSQKLYWFFDCLIGLLSVFFSCLHFILS